MIYKSAKHIQSVGKGEEYLKKLLKIKGNWFKESDYKKNRSELSKRLFVND